MGLGTALDLPNAAGRDDQPVASSHLALKEEGSALVGCVPQPPQFASATDRPSLDHTGPRVHMASP